MPEITARKMSEKPNSPEQSSRFSAI